MARRLDDWIKRYLEYTQYTESPSRFHFWTAVSTIAGALRRKCYFDMGYFKWSPNFYIILVAPSGIAAKSTSIRLGMNLLKKIPDVTMGPNTLTWQSLLPALAEARIDMLGPGGEMEPESCITFASSEFGTLLDPKDKGLLDILVDLWDGQEDEWRKRTKGAGLEIAYKPWLNIIACTTPSWISTYMGEIFVGGGFTSRCVFVYADAKRQLMAYPKMHLKPEGHKEMEEALIADLGDISCMQGEFTLTEEAMARGIAWYEELHTSAAVKKELSQFDGYMARRQGHAHKIAMILSASRSSDRIITLRDLEGAIALLQELESDMPKVLRSIGSDGRGKHLEELMKMIPTGGQLQMSTLYRIFMTRGLTIKEFEDLVMDASKAGLISIEKLESGPVLRKLSG